MKQIFKLLIAVCILPTINFGQISIEKSEKCSTLRAKIPPEYDTEGSYVLNLEHKVDKYTWTKLRSAKVNQWDNFTFENVPNGEYRVTILNVTKYGSEKLKLDDIVSNTISLECREREILKNLVLNVYPNPTYSSFQIDYRPNVDQKVKYEIISAAGVLSKSGDLNFSTFNIESLNDGQYYVTLSDERGIIGIGNFLKIKN